MHTTIVTADGFPMMSFGGDDAWLTYEKNGFLVSIERVEDESAAVIWPASGTSRSSAYVVCESAIPYLLDESGDPTDYAFRRFRLALIDFGRELSPMALAQLADVVVHAIPYVYKMPPRRRQPGETWFEATTRLNGKIIDERGI